MSDRWDPLGLRGARFIRLPYYFWDPKRDPNFENYSGVFYALRWFVNCRELRSSRPGFHGASARSLQPTLLEPTAADLMPHHGRRLMV